MLDDDAQIAVLAQTSLSIREDRGSPILTRVPATPLHAALGGGHLL